MGPDELDDLLSNIRAESKRESALSLYEGTREEDLVDEEVDERVLTLLGLNEVFDIDYGTYVSLLKERLVESRNFDKRLSSEEDELLVSEFKRVKGKVGRFKLKRKKVTSDNIGVTGPIRVSSDKFLLTGKAIVPESADSESSEDVKDIEKLLDELLNNIRLQNKEEKKKSEKERKESEDKKRKKRESDLEKPIVLAKKLLKTIVAPFQSILDRIFRFIGFTLLGYAFNNLIKWFSDPKNAEKVKLIGRILKDWWPAILGAYTLFATPFGKFIRSITGILFKFTPKLLSLIAKNPVATAATAAGVGAFISELKVEQFRSEQKKTDKTIVTPEETAKTGKTPAPPQLYQEQMLRSGIGFNGGGVVPRFGKSFFGGGQVSRDLNINDIAYEGGGGIYDDSGLRITGAGPDTQLIAAAPGEIVMSKKAVDKYGANFFLGLNKKAGGTNIPKMVNNIQLAAGGGLVRKPVQSFQGGGMVGSKPSGGFMDWWNRGRNVRVPNENTARFGGLNQYIRKNPDPTTLLGDDARQITRSNKAFQSGATGYKGWNPFKAFTPGMVKTGPTPAIRQAVERPLRAFSGASKLMKAAGGAAGSVLMDMIFPEPDFNPTLDDARRMGLPMGPQSKASPPGPPVIYTKTTYTVLPPIKAPSKTPAIARGSKIPEFIVSSTNDTRSKNASILGIADLIGA